MDVIARILDVARRNAVNAVLCVGDVFDDPDPVRTFGRGLQGHSGGTLARILLSSWFLATTTL